MGTSEMSQPTIIGMFPSNFVLPVMLEELIDVVNMMFLGDSKEKILLPWKTESWEDAQKRVDFRLMRKKCDGPLIFMFKWRITNTGNYTDLYMVDGNTLRFEDVIKRYTKCKNHDCIDVDFSVVVEVIRCRILS